MSTYLSLILSTVLFVWELKDLGHAYTASQANHDTYAAILLSLRSILIFICAPFLWGAQLFKLLGWISWDDMDSPNILQMRMFAWTINAILTTIFLWKVFQG